MSKPISFTISPANQSPFTVKVGDKVVLVSSRRSVWGRVEACPTPDYRAVKVVTAIKAGKSPRIELENSSNTVDPQGKTSHGGYRVEPYDPVVEAQRVASEANHSAMMEAFSRIRQLSDDKWQLLLIDSTRRDAIMTLVKSLST